jgi:GMP synthase (glutamine-hydrolysing)
VILSGGPASVYAEGAPGVDPALFDAGVPVFGICYGFQAMAEALGGTVKRTEGAEFGRTTATVAPDAVLFAGMPAKQPVWMSHRDAVVVAPAGFAVTGRTDGAEIAAFEHPDRRLYGMQWHPEVMHTAHGQTMLERFLHVGAGIPPTWTTANIIEDAVADVRARVGAHHVLCGLSGGADSAVAAALVHRAVGDQLLHCSR